MKKLIIVGSLCALFSASIAYATTKIQVVDTTAIYLKDSSVYTQPVTKFQDGAVTCYIYAPQQNAPVALSCVK